VGVSNLMRSEEMQAMLFEDPASKRERKVDNVVDALQDRFGSDAIHRGTTGRRTPRK